MAYRQLSVESIAEYLQGVPEMKIVFSSFNELDIREIGDGNLNYVYLVKQDVLLIYLLYHLFLQKKHYFLNLIHVLLLLLKKRIVRI